MDNAATLVQACLRLKWSSMTGIVRSYASMSYPFEFLVQNNSGLRMIYKIDG